HESTPPFRKPLHSGIGRRLNSSRYQVPKNGRLTLAVPHTHHSRAAAVFTPFLRERANNDGSEACVLSADRERVPSSLCDNNQASAFRRAQPHARLPRNM